MVNLPESRLFFWIGAFVCVPLIVAIAANWDGTLSILICIVLGLISGMLCKLADRERTRRIYADRER